MIKTLKRNIQILLISIIGFTLLLVFVVFGLININQINTENNQAINGTLYNIPSEESVVFGQSRSIHPHTFLAEYLPFSEQFIAISTNWNIDSETFNALMQEALTNPEIEGKILNNSVQFKKDVNSSRTRIAFMDLRPTQSSINQLVLTLLILFLLSLIILIVLSVYLSKKLTKPVETSLLKQKQFVADASHELKTPLTILSNHISILKSHPDDPISSQMNWINAQENEINVMNDLVSQLLYLTKHDQEELEIKKEKINLSDIVTQVALDFDPIFYEQNRQLDFNQIEPNVFCLGNIDSIKRLIKILLENALKYSFEKSTTTLILNQDKLLVTNPAHTLTTDQIDQLFDRFYRTDPSRCETGHGLGLAIAKEIVENHQGKIKVTSSNDEVTFEIILPGN